MFIQLEEKEGGKISEIFEIISNLKAIELCRIDKEYYYYYINNNNNNEILIALELLSIIRSKLKRERVILFILEKESILGFFIRSFYSAAEKYSERGNNITVLLLLLKIN